MAPAPKWASFGDVERGTQSAGVSNEAASKKPKTGRWFKIILAAVLGVVVVWSVAWFAVATFVERKIDTAMHELGSSGVSVACTNRAIGGYPFRLEVRCGRGSRVATRAGAVELGGLVAVALIYDPDRVIVEARAPAEISDGGVPVRLDWSLAHMSAALEMPDRERIALERLSLEATDLVASSGASNPLGAGLVRFHARADPAEPDSLDLALQLEGLVPYPGAEAIDLAALAVVGQGGHVLAGRPDRVLAALEGEGVPVELSELTVTSGPARISATGNILVRADGQIDGTIEVAVAGVENGHLPYMNVVLPDETAKPLADFLQTTLSYGRETMVAGTPGRAFTLTIESGRVRAGLVPLGHIPRIALAPP